jgi:peptidoglycan/LPS O-acetylase OafA/YrhL
MLGHLTQNKTQLNLLQTFRGLAALLIVLYHATGLAINKFSQIFLLNFFLFGNSGVDFFFVLSGFMIFYAHISDIGNKDKFILFLKKRFIRIYPLYWLVTFIILPVYFFVPSLGQGYERNIGVIIKSLLLYPQTENMPIVSVGWTLSYEVFFYLLFSLLIVLKIRFWLPIIAIWILGTIISFIHNFISLQNQDIYLFHIFSSYNLEFIGGCIAALFIYKFNSTINVKFLMGLLLASLALFINGKYFIIGLPQETHVIIYGIPSLLIIVSAVLLEIKKTIQIPKIFTFLGDASYSIYLTHYACLSVLVKLALVAKLDALMSMNFLMSVLVLVTIFLGCMFNLYIEKPLLTYLRQKWTQQRVFIG